MTRKLLGSSSLLLVVLSLITLSPAQDTQRFETFGGYAFTYKNPTVTGENTDFNGWNTSTTVFLNHWLGLTADLSGAYASHKVPIFCTPYGCLYEHGSYSSYSYLFGPHIVYRRSRYAPFVETLFGLHNPHTKITPLQPANCQPLPSCFEQSRNEFSYHRFAMAIGGGLDIALSRNVSIRPVEVDYVRQSEPYYGLVNNQIVDVGTNANTFRYTGGITFRFGEHLGPSR